MPDISAVGILSKPNAPGAARVVPGLVEWLRARGLGVRMDDVTAGYLDSPDFLPREKVPDGTGLLIILGGDGTLLAAARALHGREIPLFPVNLGGLGFLTAIAIDEIYPELERAFRGEHRIGTRRMLRCELIRDGVKTAEHEALNDVVVTKASIARMIDLDAFVDRNFVCAYKADGLIICTPTGSTAYSLSAGGPIIFPRVAALSMTPICPHMLTNRPVIVPDTSIITVLNRAGDSDSYLTIDG
ncbi:MAG TPA: NAD(+)/NADH kinase, partial [Bryobacteraceae bacterium]|nr:NAD(+)/NADH kinase [Bryobacteraceae bacterium]